MTCQECRFYRPIKGQEIGPWSGECRRYAPRPGSETKWPIVTANEPGCGDGKLKGAKHGE